MLAHSTWMCPLLTSSCDQMMLGVLKLAESEGRGLITTLATNPFLVVTTHPCVTLRPYPQVSTSLSNGSDLPPTISQILVMEHVRQSLNAHLSLTAWEAR